MRRNFEIEEDESDPRSDTIFIEQWMVGFTPDK
jgi:hypothetical protein